MRARAALIVVLLLALGLVGFTDSDESGEETIDPVAETCGGTLPEVAEDEQLLLETLYFHGEHPSGTPGQVAAFPTLGYASEKTMDSEPPTGEDHRYDLVTAGSNPDFAGNPLSAYWRAELFHLPELVCARTVFYGEVAGDVDVRLFADEGAAATSPDALAPAQPWNEGSTFASFEAAFGRVDLGEVYSLVLQISHNDQLDPTDTGVVAYDSATAPSRLDYVTVVPVPEEVEFGTGG